MLNVKPIMVIFLIVLLSTSIAFAAKNVISTNPIINDTIEEVIEDIVVETANNEIIVSDNAIVVPIEPVPVSIQEKKTLPIEPKPVQNIDIRKINVTDKELKKVPIKPIILASVVPQWSNEIAIPSSPTYYEDGKSYQFSIDWIDDVGIDNVYLEFNGIWYDYSSGNISKTGSTYYKILTGLSIDTHEYNWSARDADMNWNVTGPRQYVIKDPAPQLTLNGISNNLTITYGTTSTTFAACDIGLVILKRNATSVVNPEIMVLATGTYNYTATCEMTGKSRTYFLTVNKATPIINLVLTNGTASWNHDPWKYRKKLTFNNLVSSENLVNFPVLVHVNSTTISKFKSDGSDIRFFDSTDMNELSYEIEQWNSTDGFVWVKIPFITAKNNTSYIYIYYGNPSATNGQNINDVWSNNYTTVYHLANRAGNNYANSNISAGSSGIDSASVHVMSGVIGNASKFAIANASYINIGDGADVRNIRTVEAWATKTSSTEYQTVMGKYNNGGGPGWYLAFYGGIIRLMNNNDGQGHIVTATQGSSLNVPIYYAVTTNGSQEALYQYGVLNATTSYGWNSLVPFVGQNMWIGGVGVAPPTMTYFDGTIDEIRLSAISRSTYWIKATYLSQTEQFVSIGSEEQPQGGSGSIVIYPNLANATATLNINDIFFLERNGTIVASGTNLLNELIRLPVSTYNYTAYYEGNENYTAVSI
ncbi:MAG: DUF2341 domain-containing protein, partial [Nanoarchaeota archaeon]|nr:DUF2341 domain-containing protein [Nanoarchaeota archaeon]